MGAEEILDSIDHPHSGHSQAISRAEYPILISTIALLECLLCSTHCSKYLKYINLFYNEILAHIIMLW